MASDAARKADTYRKIQLGGLVIKAGISDEEPAIILGALISALVNRTGTLTPDRIAKLTPG